MAPVRRRRPSGTLPEVGVLGIPSNSSGTGAGTANAPRILRQEGLLDALASSGPVHDYGDVALPEPSRDRDRTTGLIDPSGLAAVVVGARDAVERILGDGRFPIVIGGDCPLLVGCLAGARDHAGRTGLLFVDGHEDAYPPELSLSGEAADTELAFALGMTDAEWSAQLSSLLPVVAAGDVAVLGPRDRRQLDEEAVPSIAPSVGSFVDGATLSGDPTRIAESAARRLADGPGAFWLHIDLDVLSTDALPAVNYPQDGGLDWGALGDVVEAALAEPSAVGWDVTIYDPDLDPERAAARRICRFLGDAVHRARAGEPRAARA
jgi:arginase